MQALKKFIDDERPNYEACMKSHEPLVEKAERDVEEVKSDVALTKERWDKLNAEVDERLDKMNDLNNKLKEITERMEPIEEFVTCCEQTLENLEPIGIDKEKGNQQIAELDVCGILWHSVFEIRLTLNFHSIFSQWRKFSKC